MGLNVDNELFYIEDGVLYLVKSFEEAKLVIPEGVEKIDKNWLPLINGFSFIDELVIPGSLKVIPMSFFMDRMIKKIYLSDGIKEIGPFSFMECSNLEEIEIPSSVEKIGVRSFYGCSKLNKVMLYDTLEKIGSKAFVIEEVRDGDVLQNIVLPKEIVLRYSSYLGLNMLVDKFLLSNVGEMGINRFLNTNIILDGIKLSEKEFLKIKNKFMSFGISSIEQNLVKQDDCSKMIIANGIEVIPKMSFMWNGFSECFLPNSVKLIDDYSFCSCKNLEEMEIPSSVEVVGKVLFGNCGKLKKLIIYDTLEKIDSGAFNIEESIVNGSYYVTKLPEEIVFRYSSFEGLASLINKIAFSGHFDFLEGKVPDFKIVLEGPELTDIEDISIMTMLINCKVLNIEKKYCKSSLKRKVRRVQGVVHW